MSDVEATTTTASHSVTDYKASIAEGNSVQLTRIEGTVNLIAYQMSEVRGRVDSHEVQIAGLKATTQSLKEGAEASKEKAIALALALKDAKDQAEATSRAEAAKETARNALVDRVWLTPTRLLGFFGGFVALGSLLVTLYVATRNSA